MLLIFKKLQSGATVIYYTLNNDFFYTRVAYVFVPQKDFYYVQDDTVAFFFFLCKNLISFSGIFCRWFLSSSERF